MPRHPPGRFSGPRGLKLASDTYGFPKRYRLNRPGEFIRVLRFSRYRRSRGPLRIFAVANTMPGARLGLIIGKRAVRRASARNALKRVAREVFRTTRARLPAMDLVVQLRGPAAPGEFRAWLQEAFGAMAEGTDRADGS